MDTTTLRAYARLLVRSSLNLRRGQPLYIDASIACEDFVCLVQEEAFAAGASDVTVRWISDRFERGRLENPDCTLVTAEGDCARVARLVEEKVAYLKLESPDPAQWASVPAARLQARQRAEAPMRGAFRVSVELQNVIACAATPAWAKAVYPELPEDEALDRLWQALLRAVMADRDDPAAAWKAEIAKTDARRAYLNGKQYKKLRLKSDTCDLTLGLPDEQDWMGGGCTASDGVFFMPNLPSYEVFTSPKAAEADGWVKATMPLNFQGKLICDIELHFAGGKVTEYNASAGRDLLGEIIGYDDTSDRLGEIALVEQTTAVAQQGIVFCTTVCDENASCHMALGSGFCMKGEETARRLGINRSGIHVDFMFGSDNLSVSGLTAAGQWEEFFRGGLWSI